MKENKFVEYDAQVSLVEIAIRNIKSIGADTSAFDEKLRRIKDKTQNNVLELKRNIEMPSTEKNNSIDNIYSNAIVELSSFIEELNEYLLYFQVINKCLYVFNSQDNNNYELSKIVDDIIDALKTIKTLHTIDDEKVISSLYEVVYTAIKAEYRKSGKSKLLAYCKQDKIDSIFLTKCILKDIDELRNSNFDMESIDSQMYKLNFSNSESMYLDEKIVWLIAVNGNKESYIKELTESITRLKDDLKANNSKLYPLVDEKDNICKEIDKNNENLTNKSIRNAKTVVESLVPLFITIATIGALGGASTLLFGGEAYMTTTEYYTSDKGLKPDAKLYERRLANYNGESVDELTTLTIYEPWSKPDGQSYYERKTLVAEIPNEDFEELSQMETIDPNNTEYRFTEDEDYANGLSEDANNGKYFTVVRKVQDASQVKKAIASKNENVSGPIISAYIISGFIYLGAMLITWTCGRTFGIIISIREIMNDMRYLDKTDADKSKIKELLERLRVVNQKMNDLISQNAEVNDKYNELMSKAENKELLKGYQLGLSLVDSYLSELDESKSLSLSSKKTN